MRFLLSLFLCVLLTAVAAAHPMPNSIMLLDVKENSINAELRWPLKELQLVFPDEAIDTNISALLARKGDWLDNYLRQHMSIEDPAGHPWTYQILSKTVGNAEQDATGRFHQLSFQLLLQPPAGTSPRHFTMRYDAIMHQLVTHKMLISIRQDWEGGFSKEDSTNADLGMLMMDMRDNKVPPVIINLDDDGFWKGFKSMVMLGIAHISEGTDHLLFLLVLLLPAPLLYSRRRWLGFGGTKYSIKRLLKIVTAFTIGHSITLMAGALGWLRLPSQPVEILIAVSILVTAIHAVRPLFAGKEVWIATGFGLVHGLAFASTLGGLHLSGSRMALSILGFNLGIELMQLFVIFLIIPWLILLCMSTNRGYQWLRILGALLAGIAAIAWITERVTRHPNAIGNAIQKLAVNGRWLILGLAIIAVLAYLFGQHRNSAVAKP